MEWVGFIRKLVWHNSGFGSLRKIRNYLENYEPRYDPTVVPLPLSDEEIKIHSQEALLADIVQDAQRGISSSGAQFSSAANYRDLYLSGQLTPIDVVKAILPLVRRDTSPPGKHFQAWQELHIGMILKTAEASTVRYQNKQSLGPLDGVPTAIKDDYDLDGYSTMLGSRKDYAGEMSDGNSMTSWCVRKLEEAGAIIIGKLHMHEYGLGK